MWLRYLLVLGLLVLAYWLLGRLLNRLGGGAGTGPAAASRRLVRDPVCRTYVTLDRAVSRTVDGQVHHFCSETCARRFEEKEAQGKAIP